MVTTLVEQIASFFGDLVAFIPPGLFLSLSTAFIEGGKYFTSFRHEFVGTLLMVSCTFSAGKWIGKESREVAWISHAIGVIAGTSRFDVIVSVVAAAGHD